VPPGGLRWTAESMATMRPACAPAVQKRMLWGLPRQPSAAQGSRSALPSSMSSRNSLRAHTLQLTSCSFFILFFNFWPGCNVSWAFSGRKLVPAKFSETANSCSSVPLAGALVIVHHQARSVSSKANSRATSTYEEGTLERASQVKFFGNFSRVERMRLQKSHSVSKHNGNWMEEGTCRGLRRCA
jgi:hypothetical protein